MYFSQYKYRVRGEFCGQRGTVFIYIILGILQLCSKGIQINTAEHNHTCTQTVLDKGQCNFIQSTLNANPWLSACHQFRSQAVKSTVNRSSDRCSQWWEHTWTLGLYFRKLDCGCHSKCSWSSRGFTSIGVLSTCIRTACTVSPAISMVSQDILLRYHTQMLSENMNLLTK